MKLRIYVSDLSPNDADGLLRDCSRHGADGKIAFSKGENVSVFIKQEGTLEDLMATASIVFHEQHFAVRFSN